jgi:hypothetical protein
MKKSILKCFVLILITIAALSCDSVKPYQRVYLNDHEMKPGQPGARNFEESVQIYREGALGGGSSKTSGGCGCN